MICLTPHEVRVLGVLIEKAQTTPAQYPLTLNAIVSGCNQKNNRQPVLNVSEDQALDALDGLRGKSLAREVMLSGSRVAKFRHTARETLELDTSQLVVLTELMLRGPQTVGEIRGRASRMHALESTDVLIETLQSLMSREEPLVRSIAPAPGSRAGRFTQLLCPDAHALEASPAGPATEPMQSSRGDLEARIDGLEREVADLRKTIQRLEAVLPQASTD